MLALRFSSIPTTEKSKSHWIEFIMGSANTIREIFLFTWMKFECEHVYSVENERIALCEIEMMLFHSLMHFRVDIEMVM